MKKQKKKTIKATKVSFDEDALVALYIGENLVFEGCNDFIHNEIDGWIKCLEHQGQKVDMDHFYVEVDMDNYPDNAPKTIKKLLSSFKKSTDN